MSKNAMKISLDCPFKYFVPLRARATGTGVQLHGKEFSGGCQVDMSVQSAVAAR
jgi:hypothetical protein